MWPCVLASSYAPDHGGIVISYILRSFSPPYINPMVQTLKILKPRVDWNQILLCPLAPGLHFREVWKIPAKILPLNQHPCPFCMWILCRADRELCSLGAVEWPACGAFPPLRIPSSPLSSWTALGSFHVWQSTECKHIIRCKGCPEMVAGGEPGLKKRGFWLKMSC